MTSLGIRTIVDLRFPVERERQPSHGPAEVTTVLAHPDGMEAADQSVFMELIQSGGLRAYSVEDAAADYRKMVIDGVELVIETLRVIADAERQPVLFHCTAGKDRTGFAAALVLLALGVSRDDVMRDYLLTNQRLKPKSEWKGLTPDVASVLYRVQPEFLDAAFDVVQQQYGGVESYLREGLGLREAERSRLRELYLEASAAGT